MEEPEDSSSVERQQRTAAVLKLKRAASLPRMKNGRRPPMHPEGYSEGERQTPSDEGDAPDNQHITPPPEPADAPEAQPLADEQPADAPPPPEPASTPAPDADDEETVTTPTQKRRRSRSRPRSRNSKDLKGKGRATQTPTPVPATGESSQDEAPPQPVPSPPQLYPVAPTLMSPSPMSPIAANLLALQQNRLLRSPTPNSLDPSTYLASPPTPLPTLEAISRNFGLYRSNSAGRQEAMSKLTGGRDMYEGSPSPTPSRLRRNNTVAGGERTAARKLMLERLATRQAKESDAETAPGDEQLTPPRTTPSPSRRHRRRRSRRSQTNTPVPDAEPFSPLPTAIFAPTPQPPPAMVASVSMESENQMESQEEHRVPTPNVPVSVTPDVLDVDVSQKVSTPEKEQRRRSVVVEEDYEQPFPDHEQQPMPKPPQDSSFRSEFDGSFGFNEQSVPISIDPAAVFTDEFRATYSPSRLYQQYDEQGSSQAVPFASYPRRKAIPDDREEQVLYGDSDSDDEPTPQEREISWNASLVLPINEDDHANEDDEREDDDEQPSSPRSSSGFSPPDAYENTSVRDSSDSQNMAETYSELRPSYTSPSPSSTPPVQQRTIASDDSQTFPTRLSVASRSPMNAEFTDIEDKSGNESTSKKGGERSSRSWGERVKNTFTRRSRSNSIAKLDNTEYGMSRESGGSLSQTPVMQGHNASDSYVPLPASPGSRGGISPASPPPITSAADLARYQDAKLFPFPGIVDGLRRQGLLVASSSTPDISALTALHADDQPIRGANEMAQGRPGMMHQRSDTGLKDKYINNQKLSPMSASSPYHDYFSPPSGSTTPQTSSAKLPTTLGGVRQWLGNRSIFSPNTPPASSPAGSSPGGNATKKASLSDLLKIRKETELVSDWEEVGSTPTTSTSGSTLIGKQQISGPIALNAPPPAIKSTSDYSDTERTPKARRLASISIHPAPVDPAPFISEKTDMPSPPDPSSATPDPLSSLSDYPANSMSDSSSAGSSQSRYSHMDPAGSIVLERLDENLARGSRSPMWASAIEEPPRKPLIASAVLQVVNANTVKDRFLFLFTDLLVIAKPVTMIPDNEDGSKLEHTKFIVKSVVQLHNLRCAGDPPTKPAYSGYARNPLMQSFIHQFAKDPDQAISSLLSKSETPDDPVLLGKLLFRVTDLDRGQLGEYLSRRTSKFVLKNYLSSFGFIGLRIDHALRAFLLSIHTPSRPQALEYLLDAFASRWYEANADSVTYDRSLTIKLVRLLVQLNDKLHGGISQEPGRTAFPRQDVRKGFTQFFRTADPRGLIPDDVLDDLYMSVSWERLSQARAPDRSQPELGITIKRPVPTQLTYKIQSEPVVLRIPQADPHLSIQLYGQDLVFDPPVLTFQKSSEASFRVMGTSLGTKTLMMCRSGPNALKYTGLPLSNSITIERAFMRNTFQIAFINHQGVKRRYMFSVDDPLIRNEWAASLRRNVDLAVSAASSSKMQRFYKAVDTIAFKALQETLMGPEETSSQLSLEHALSGLNGTSPGRRNGNTNGSRGGVLSMHARSKSRSKVYHRTGAGKNEQDLNGTSDSNTPSSDSHRGGEGSFGDFLDMSRDVPQWTRRELELQCLTNSSIALVLSYLQVGAPEHGQRTTP